MLEALPTMQGKVALFAVVMLRKVCGRGGLTAGECALVGDDPMSDQRGAEGAGWRWALVSRPEQGLGEALAKLGL